MSIDVNVQNDLVIVTESSEDITVNVSNARGADGVGVPTGGTTGQVLKKLSNTNYDTYWALDGGGVPYSGASGSVNLGPYDLTVNELTIGKGLNGVANNTALGKRTLFHNTTGNYNTAVGHEAGHNNTTGQYNVAIGQSAMFTATTAGQNTAIGVNALLLATSGGSNVAVGLDTLQHITTGSSNTAIGYNAGSHITGGSTPNTTATNSVFIGRDSKAAADGQTNQIVIGQNAVGNGSNTATFGNTATTANYFTGSVNGGSFVKSGGTSSQFLKADGSVDSSSYVGGSGATGQVAYWNGTNSQTGSSDLIYNNTNKSFQLSNSSNSNSTRGLYLTQTTADGAGSLFVFQKSRGGVITSGTTIGVFDGEGFDGSAYQKSSRILFATSGTISSGIVPGTISFFTANASGVLTSRTTINESGLLYNVGNFKIDGNALLGGTTDGGQRLQVYGDAFIKGSGATFATTALLIQNSASTEILKLTNEGALYLGAAALRPQTSSTNLGVYLTGSSSFLIDGTNAITGANTSSFLITRPYLPTSGSVQHNAINLNLTINQTGGANGITRGLYVNPILTAAADWRSIEWSNNSGWGLYGAGTANNYLAGRLGIGNTNPTNILDILVNSNTAQFAQIKNNSAGDSAQQGFLSYNNNNEGGGFISYSSAFGNVPYRNNLGIISTKGVIFGADQTIASGGSSNMSFVIGGYNASAAMTLTAAGRLLLGTTTEGTFLLDVNGTARVSGTLTLTPAASDNAIVINNGGYINYGTTVYVRGSSTSYSVADSSFAGKFLLTWGGNSSYFNTGGNYIFNGTTANASAILQADSTTKGFLPPRMTTTQKNAIATPAAGLVVYDTDTNKLCCYNGTSWNDLF